MWANGPAIATQPSVNDRGEPVPPVSPNSQAVYFLGGASPNKKNNGEHHYSYGTSEIDQTCDGYASMFVDGGQYRPILFDHKDHMPAGQIIMAYRNENDDMCIFGRLTNETPGGRTSIRGVTTRTIEGLSSGLQHQVENSYIADLPIRFQQTVGHSLEEVSVTPNPCYPTMTWIKYYADNPGDILETIANLCSGENRDPSVAIKRLPEKFSALPSIINGMRSQGKKFIKPTEPPRNCFLPTTASNRASSGWYNLPGSKSDPSALNVLRSFFSHVEHQGKNGSSAGGDLGQFFVQDPTARPHPHLPGTFTSSRAVRTRHSSEQPIWVGSDDMSNPALQQQAQGGGGGGAHAASGSNNAESLEELKKQNAEMQKKLDALQKFQHQQQNPNQSAEEMVMKGMGMTGIMEPPGGIAVMMSESEYKAHMAAQELKNQQSQKASGEAAQSAIMERAKLISHFMETVPDTKANPQLLNYLVDAALGPKSSVPASGSASPSAGSNPGSAIPAATPSSSPSLQPPVPSTGSPQQPINTNASADAPAAAGGQSVAGPPSQSPSPGPVPVSAAPMTPSQKGVQVPVTPDPAAALAAAQNAGPPSSNAIQQAVQDLIKNDPKEIEFLLTQHALNKKKGIDSTTKLTEAEAQAKTNEILAARYLQWEKDQAAQKAKEDQDRKILESNAKILQIGEGLIAPVSAHITKANDGTVTKFIDDFRAAKTDPRIALTNDHLVKLTDIVTKASAEIASQSQAESVVNQKHAFNLKVVAGARTAEDEIQRIHQKQLAQRGLGLAGQQQQHSQSPQSAQSPHSGSGAASNQSQPQKPSAAQQSAAPNQAGGNANSAQNTTNTKASAGDSFMGDGFWTDYYQNAAAFYTGDMVSPGYETIDMDPDTWIFNNTVRQSSVSSNTSSGNGTYWPYSSGSINTKANAASDAEVQQQFARQVGSGSNSSSADGGDAEFTTKDFGADFVFTPEMYETIATRAGAPPQPGTEGQPVASELTPDQLVAGQMQRFMNFASCSAIDFVKLGINPLLGGLSAPNKRARVEMTVMPCGDLFTKEVIFGEIFGGMS